jgi:hypothetical protein
VAPPKPVVVTVHGGELELPVWSGPSPYTPPQLAPGGHSGEDPSGVIWRVERDVLAGTTSCVVDHGSTYDTPHDGTATEHYEGRVTVDSATFEQGSTATTTFTLRWPDLEMSSTASMTVAITADSLDVAIDLSAEELTAAGRSTVGTRHWHEVIPREA